MRNAVKLLSVLTAGLLAGALSLPAAAEEPQTQPAKANESQSRPAEPKPAEEKAPAEKVEEPDHIKVQHILIGFKGTAKPTRSTRTADEAASLAREILERARKGEDFDELVKQYTDDRPPGIYAMANNGVAIKPPPPREFPRGQMVAAFGNVGFVLKVGEVGMAEYDPQSSPYGYHIIKRIE